MSKSAVAGALLAFTTMVAARANPGGTPAHVNAQFPAQVIYPKSAQIAGETGVVELALLVDSDGQAQTSYRIIKSSGHADLDTAALQSAMNWHYIPAHNAAGDPTWGWVYLKINYHLPPGKASSPAH
jgi:TonB family protein